MSILFVPLTYQPDAPAALANLRILDLSHRVTGNAIAHALADHAAEIIKIEQPGIGYALRNWEMRDLSTSRKVYYRNKKRHLEPAHRTRASDFTRPGDNRRGDRREFHTKHARGTANWTG